MPRTLASPQLVVFLSLLREARERQGLTQGAVAESIGLRQSDVSKVERGARRLDVLELRDWTRALGLSLAEFCAELDDRLGTHEALLRQGSPKRHRGA